MTDQDDLDALVEGYAFGWQVHWWRQLGRAAGSGPGPDGDDESGDSGEDPLSWYVGLLHGRPVGLMVALVLPIAQGGLAVAGLYVQPDARRRGVGSALLRQAELSTAGMPGLQVSYVEGDAEAEASVAAWGLREVARHHESVLDLTEIDRSAFAAKAAAPGVELASIPDFDALDGAFWRRLHGFLLARFAEAPDSADGGGELPYEAMRGTFTEPWMVALATEGDEWLGLTCVLRRPGTTDVANTFFTGVVPGARGRGIASALKCFQALELADRGITRLYTQNMVGNDPILAANRTLGFTRDSGYVDVVRTFG